MVSLERGWSHVFHDACFPQNVIVIFSETSLTYLFTLVPYSRKFFRLPASQRRSRIAERTWKGIHLDNLSVFFCCWCVSITTFFLTHFLKKISVIYSENSPACTLLLLCHRTESYNWNFKQKLARSGGSRWSLWSAVPSPCIRTYASTGCQTLSLLLKPGPQTACNHSVYTLMCGCMVSNR